MVLDISDSGKDEKSLFPIVAIGASAGGLQAFEDFLQALPPEFCFSIIFIQHLPQAQKSVLPELLRKQRPDLEFNEMADGQDLLPGHIYLYPPDQEIRIRRGTIQGHPRTGSHKHLPIDDFFISLSEEAAERIVAVILSGAGTDGVLGVQVIKAAGGTIFAQDPATAEFAGMPMEAINTGDVDGVLAPRDIAGRLLKIFEMGMPYEFSEGLVNLVESELLFRVIYDKTGHHFNHYKKNVIARRIRRRMNLHGISSAAAYLEMLDSGRQEAEMLASDLLIGVTSFFRDRPAWNALEAEVIKHLAARKDDAPVRIWVPACATGEEAYSIAIMLRDELDVSGAKRELQVFATDVNERALEKARAGLYASGVMDDIPLRYTKKFLSCTSDGLSVKIGNSIRQHVIFAKHDLMTDPPFSHIDLIMCRNLLIYLDPYAQDKCLSLFYYALNNGGYLFLGNAESPGSNSVIFNPIGQKKHRIYQKVESTAYPKRTFSFPFSLAYASKHAAKTPFAAEQRPTAAELAQKALVKEFAPAAVAINQSYEVLYCNGSTNIYLNQPEGVPTLNLLELLPKNLRTRIRGVLYKVIHDDKPVSIRARVSDNKNQQRQVTINVSKVNENLFLITFHEKSDPAEAEEVTPDPSDFKETAMRQLENELCATREDLQSHIEQLESLSEELQSSNEEMQASNEEMETSKEELQSLNEELLTVNTQLQAKIEEQEETNNDLVNAAEALRESEKLYRSLFDNMLNGLAYCRMIFEEDRPTDFIYLAVNDAFTTSTGLKDVAGKRVSEVIPGIREADPELFEIYGRVALSGTPERFEMYVASLRMWFSIAVFSPRKEHFVAVFDVITERKLAEEALEGSKEQIQLILNSSAEGIYGLDLSGDCVFCNQSCIRILGYNDEKDLIGKNMHELIHHTKADGTAHIQEECDILRAFHKGDYVHNANGLLWRADGESFPAEYWAHPILKDGRVTGAVVSIIDITDRISLENQLRQAQKMEAIGTLAGGVAHDFNNILMSVIGFATMAKKRVKDDDKTGEFMEEILASAYRAAELTHSLLAFSRKQTIVLKRVDLNDVVRKIHTMLVRIIGEDIELQNMPVKGELVVLADQGQIEQILLNLATNARDAMPDGGTLTIRTDMIQVDSGYAETHLFETPGLYAVLTVSDTGTGMDYKTMENIFEPFFTTKEVGKGTGLGLAMVYGIVKQHGGNIKVYSEPGIGTTFRVYLPMVKAAVEERPVTAETTPLGKGETILLAEDDDRVRRITSMYLEEYGYKTIEAENGEDAAKKFIENKDAVAMLLLDVIMPLKNGRAVYEEVKAVRPGIKVIYMSGYTDDVISGKGLLEEGFAFISKPVDPDSLARKIREVLDS